MTTVLIAIDESQESQDAARTAAMCFGSEAHYVAIYVEENWRGSPGTPGSLWGAPMTWGGVYPYAGLSGYPYDPALAGRPGMRAPADEIRDAGVRAEQLAADSGVRADGTGDIGDPAEAIVRAAEDNGVDVIVLGWPHRTWFTKLFSGSTSDDVIKRAHRPVMLVPGTEAD